MNDTLTTEDEEPNTLWVWVETTSSQGDTTARALKVLEVSYGEDRQRFWAGYVVVPIEYDLLDVGKTYQTMRFSGITAGGHQVEYERYDVVVNSKKVVFSTLDNKQFVEYAVESEFKPINQRG